MSSASRSSSSSDGRSGGGATGRSGTERSFADLHCHTAWSPDSLSRPADVARVAAERGITHLAITDHDHVEGALEARQAAPSELTIIVGEEIRAREGDLVALFIEGAVPSGLSAAETAAAIHEQGGLVGLPHPFDRFRGSLLKRDGPDAPYAEFVDYVEAFNARVPFVEANGRAAAWAAEHGLPGVAVSDAHTLGEVGVAYVVLPAPVDGADGLRAALRDASLVASRASLLARAVTPVARIVQRLRFPDRFGSRAP